MVDDSQCAMKVGTDSVLLGTWTDVGNAQKILDIGTGSALLALMFAQRTRDDATITGVELLEADARQATENAQRSPWQHRITIHHAAIQQFESSSPFDLIVTNPPFFHQRLPSPSARRSAARHTGMLTFIELLAAVDRLLAPQGTFALILPLAEGKQFHALANARGFFCYRYCNVTPHPGKARHRILMQFSRTIKPCEITDLVLQDGPFRSAAFGQLTADFYL